MPFSAKWRPSRSLPSTRGPSTALRKMSVDRAWNSSIENAREAARRIDPRCSHIRPT
jgi:hypothetical protein